MFCTISSENLTVDRDKASALIIIMLIFDTLLLGNLLKEVRRNNMLITLELKKTSASFQNLPTLICVLRILNFSCTFLLRTCNTVARKKHCSRNFGNVRFNCGCYCIMRFCIRHCFSKLIYFSFHWLLEIQPHHFHRLMVKALTVLY